MPTQSAGTQGSPRRHCCAAATLWLSVLAIQFAATGAAQAQPARSSARIAMLPIVVHSAEDPRYLREGLADMLAARLDQAGVFAVSRVEDPEAATTRLREAMEIARGQGVDFVLFGSFTRFGQGASLDIQCAAVSDDDQREPLREIFVHSGSIGDVIPDLDELVGKVARFAVQDYSVPPAVGAGPGPRTGSGQVDDLRRRIDRLERRLDELAREPSPGGPGPARP